MKNFAKSIVYLLISFFIITLFTCDKEELEISLDYAEMMKQAYDETGEGRIISLTIEEAVELDGSISHDGKFIVYCSNADRENYDIYLRSMKDITTVQLTSHPSKDHSPALSSGAHYVAYVSEKDDPEGDIFVVPLRPRAMLKNEKNINKENVPLDDKAKNITQIFEKETKRRLVSKDANPAWSPNERWIAFSSKRGENAIENIYIVRRNGKDLQQLTTKGGMYPRFSPDGKEIVYISYENKDSKGDVYSVNIETGVITQITDTPYVEMHPTYLNDSNSIAYTLIDKDTDKDGMIDLSDASVLQYKNLTTGDSYPLTFYSTPSFGPRWFPIMGLKYTDSELVNYNGVIVYAQQAGSNIDLNILPEYGVIPKKQTAREQYELAMKYLNEYNDYDRYMIALMRVHYFFYDKTDFDSQIYTIRALKKAIEESEQNGNKKKVKEYFAILKKHYNNSGTAYGRIITSYLSKEIAGKNGVSNLEEQLGKLKKKDPLYPYLLEDIGDNYLSKNKLKKATENYSKIVSSYPSFSRIQDVRLLLAELTYNKDDAEISDYFKTVLTSGSQYQKDEAIRFLEQKFMSSYKPALRVQKMSSFLSLYGSQKKAPYNNMNALFTYVYCKTLYLQKQNETEIKKSLSKALSQITTEDVLYFSINKLLADISNRDKKYTQEEDYLLAAVTEYKSRWKQRELEEVVLRLIQVYEQKGGQAETQGNNKLASEIYEGYTEFLSSLKDKNISQFDNLYNEYGARAHVLYIDTYYKRNKYTYESLEDLWQNKYLKNISKARKSNDKAYIYGLGYLYTKMALHLDGYYKKNDTLEGVRKTLKSDSVTLKPVRIAEYFRKSVDTLDWALFMDDTFTDPYLLKGWIYQYVDRRREGESEDNPTFADYFYKYFPDYLLESGTSIYERSLEANNELKYPDKEGNLHLNIANTYFLLVNYKEALKHYQAAEKYKRAFASHKQEALFYYHLAYCYYQLGMFDDSRRILDKVHLLYMNMSGGSIKESTANTFVRIYRYYALFDRLEENYTETINWYNKILDVSAKYGVDVDRARYLQEIAWCYIQMRKFNKAEENINSAHELLKTYSDYEKKYNVDIRTLAIGPFDGLPPIPVPIGSDKAVFGETRLYRAFDTFTKKMYNYTLLEMIYYAKGDYNSVIKNITNKLAFIKDKDDKIHKQIRLRAYNNLGHAYFLLNDYALSEKFFKQAWDYADEVEDQDGMFKAIENMTSLYSFLLENHPDSMEKPLERIDKFLKQISKYAKEYEKVEVELQKEKLKENYEVRGLGKPTEEDYAKIEAKVKKEAEEKYFSLDIFTATLNFYKAELLYDNYNQAYKAQQKGNTVNIYNQNQKVYSLYSESAKTFQNALDNKTVQKRKRLKLMLNASICREKLGQIKEAFTFLEQADKVAAKYKYEDILYLIYYKEARFIQQYSKEVGYPYKKAGEYFQKSISLIEKLPQQYTSRKETVNEIYDYYIQYLTDFNDGANSFKMRESKRSFNLVHDVYMNSPSFSNDDDNNDFADYKLLVTDLIRAKNNQTTLIEKYENDKHVQVIAAKEKVVKLENDLADLQKNRSLFSRFVGINVDLDKIEFNDVAFDFAIEENEFVSWVFKDKKVTLTKKEIINPQTNFKKEVLAAVKKYQEKTKYNYIIFNSSVYSYMNSGPQTSNPAITASNEPEFMYIFSPYDSMALERLSTVVFNKKLSVEKGIDSELEGDNDLFQYSVLEDNVSSKYSLSQAIFAGKVKPSLLIRQDSGNTIDNYRILYYSSLYNRTPNFVLHNETNKDSIYNKTSGYFNGSNNFASLNQKHGYYAFGKPVDLNPDEDEYALLADTLFDVYQEKLIMGEVEDARFYLFRWKESVLNNKEAELRYPLYLAQIYDYEMDTQKAYSELEQDQPDLNLYPEIAKTYNAYKIFYLLKRADIKAAEKIMTKLSTDNDPFIATKDYAFFQKAIDHITSNTAFQSVPELSYLKRYEAVLLAGRYNLIFGYYKAAATLFDSLEKSKMSINHADHLILHQYSNKIKSESAPNARIRELLNITKATELAEVKKSFNESVYSYGLYDSLSKYAILFTFKRLPELNHSLDINQFYQQGMIISTLSSGNYLDSMILLTEMENFYITQKDQITENELLTMQSSFVTEQDLTIFKEMTSYKFARYSACAGNLSSLKKYLSSLKDLGPTHALYKKYQLLQTESYIYNKNFDKAEETLTLLTGLSAKQNLEKSTVAVLLDTEKALANKGIYPSSNTIKSNVMNVLKKLEGDEELLKMYDRDDLLVQGMDNLIVLFNKELNYNSALLITDLKKQLHFQILLPQMVTATYSSQLSKTYVQKSMSKKKGDLKKFLSTNNKVYYNTFLPAMPLTEIENRLEKGEVIAVISEENDDILVWLITPEGVKPLTISAGYTSYKSIETSYSQNLSSLYSMGQVSSNLNDLFANLLAELSNYKNVHLVLSSNLQSLPVEIMGKSSPLIEDHRFTYLPTLSSFVLNDNKEINLSKGLMVLQNPTIAINDKLELLAIKEAGVNIGDEAEHDISHIQKSVVYDPVAKSITVESLPYSDAIAASKLVFLSTNYKYIMDNSTFSLMNGLLGAGGVIINGNNIRDVNSAILVREFYSGIVNEEPIGDSFNKSIQKVYFNPKYSHPGYWINSRIYITGDHE